MTSPPHSNLGGYCDYCPPYFTRDKFKKLTSVLQVYDLGCRTMIIAGLPHNQPIQITANFKNPKNRACVQEQNLDAQSYNQKLANLLPKLQESLPGSKIVYADSYEPLNDMINIPQKYGMPPSDLLDNATVYTHFTPADIACFK
jgi:hypothetical protein